MNETHDQSELTSLLIALAESDGGLDAEQRRRLDALLREDAAARAIYIRFTAAHALLRFHFGAVRQDDSTAEPASILLEVLEQEERARRLREQQLAQLRPSACPLDVDLWHAREDDRPPARHIVIPKFVVYGAAAALAALIIFAVMPLFHASGPTSASPTSIATETRAVATLVQQVDTQWADGMSLLPGDTLKQGGYELLAGLAEIRMHSGASIVIEGPARFALEAENAGSLTRGKLVGYCRPGSEGLSIRTPGALVVDIGTEFGVYVLPSGETHTHVFAGRVRISPASAMQGDVAGEIVEANQARIIDAQGTRITPVDLAPSTFVRHEEMEARVNPITPYRRWFAHSQMLRRDPSLVAYYTFDDEEDNGSLTNVAGSTFGRLRGTIIGGERVAGRFEQGRALRLNRGNMDHIRVPHDDALNIRGPITVAAWIRRPGGALGGHIVARRSQTDDLTIQYQLAAFGERDGGPFNARGRLGLQWLSGTDDFADVFYLDNVLRWDDERWQHVAVVDDGNSVCFYLDGQLLDVRKKTRQRNDLVTDLFIGTSGPRQDARSFDGEIDEVMVFSRALSADEMMNLFRVGRPD